MRREICSATKQRLKSLLNLVVLFSVVRDVFPEKRQVKLQQERGKMQLEVPLMALVESTLLFALRNSVFLFYRRDYVLQFEAALSVRVMADYFWPRLKVNFNPYFRVITTGGS